MLNDAFFERMKKLLGDDYARFDIALGEKPTRAIRINTLKVDLDKFLEGTALKLKKIPYTAAGYTVDAADGLGNSPEHHSGCFYIQDGGAMATVSALPALPRNAMIADLCAAPGGKSSALAELIPEGFLLANEYVRKRATILLGNIERMGIKNATVTSLDTALIAQKFGAVFDAVVVDAPCSGEGMLRKGDAAASEWSEANVIMSAARQEQILNNAAELVKCGGYLLYSTCTYSLEENEMQVNQFLTRHSDFELIPIENPELIMHTADGISYAGEQTDYLRACRRFYPHIAEGEGQFIALMQRMEMQGTSVYKRERLDIPRGDERRLIDSFLQDTLQELPECELVKSKDNIFLIPAGMLPISGAIINGVNLGEIRGKLLIPHHHFFSAYGKLFKNQENLTDERIIEKYLRGEEIPASDANGGYVAILAHGVPLGGGKASSGVIKNHYPKGLRLLQKS